MGCYRICFLFGTVVFEVSNSVVKASEQDGDRILEDIESREDAGYSVNEGSSGARTNVSSSRSTTSNIVPDSTDWVASTLTRRFGIGGGLAWLGVLTFGVVSEQMKTRFEIAEQEKNTKEISEALRKTYTTKEGITITDLKLGGGAQPRKGDLVVLDFKAYANGELFEDTKARGKPIVLLYGSRPFTAGMNEGVELALASMKAGGKRIVEIPPKLGFGDQGTAVRPTGHAPDKSAVVPGGATLRYELELVRVSIPPS